MPSPPTFAFFLSTPGAVMGEVLKTRTVREATRAVIATEDGQALATARSHEIEAIAITAPTNEDVCSRLLDTIRTRKIGYILSFYTRFYAASIRDEMRDRIINFHPSLLPAFKGMDGFSDALAYDVKVAGSTVELITDVMDEGKIVMQAAYPVDPYASRAALRDRLFTQQCKTLIQVVDWIRHDRLRVDGTRIDILNARIDGTDFVPALENPEAIAFRDLAAAPSGRCRAPA